jgi:hypothetical protein
MKMSAQITSEDARQAMLARAIQWMLLAAYEGDQERFDMAKGYATAMHDLAEPESMRRSIEFDLSNGGYRCARGLEVAHATLTTRFKHATLADVEKIFPAEGAWGIQPDQIPK